VRLASILRLRLRSLFSRGMVEHEFDEELRYHLERQIEEEIAAGKSREEARYVALRSIKDIEQRKEKCRDMRSMNWFENASQDRRHGFRMLWKNPGFSLVAVLTLALGIGANTAIFSAVNSLLLRPLPYRNSKELVVIATVLKKFNTDRANLSYADFLDLKKEKQVFDAGAVHFEQPADVTGRDYPERIKTSLVSGEYFRVMGAAPQLGRFFTPEESVDGQATVAVLTNGYWLRRYGGDADILEHTIEIGGVQKRIIGVTRPESTWPDDTELFLPLGIGDNPPPTITRRDSFSIAAIARLKTDVTLAQAQARLNVLARQIEHDNPMLRVGTGLKLFSLSSWIIGPQFRQMLLIMMSAVGVVLLIACSNLANLLLAKGVSRNREFAIRLALGAGWSRVTRQVLTEQVAVAALGTVAGALLGIVGVHALVRLAPADTPRLNEIHPNLASFLFTAVVAGLSTLLFAFLPALHSAKADASSAFRDGDRSSSAGVRGSKLRGLLVISEMALSMVLLVSAALLLQTFANLTRINIGFQPQDQTTFELSLPNSRYASPQKTAAAMSEIRNSIRRIPGVLDVGATSALPTGGGGSYLGKTFVGVGKPEPPVGAAVSGAWDVVLPGYFETLGIRRITGRVFTDRDNQASQPVIILSQSLATRLFPNENSLGKRVRAWRDESFDREVVGVVGDVPYWTLVDTKSEVAYVPHGQQGWNTMDFVVKTHISGPSELSAIRASISAQDNHLALAEVRTMNEVLAKSLARPRFIMFLLAAFACVAVTMAAVGVYGVLSYAVNQRAREIGIRLALGAQRSTILRLVTWRGLVLTGCGVIIGTAIAMLATQFLAGLLFGIKTHDPATFCFTALLLLMTGFVACLVPALRATSVDPVETLHYQ
jgi:predicted permease